MPKIFIFILVILQVNNILSNTIKDNIQDLYLDKNNNYNSASKRPNQINISESRIYIGKIYLLLIGSLLTFIVYSAIRNTIIMNKLIKEGFSIIKKNFEFEELDIGNLRRIIVYIFPFFSKVYYIKDLGILPIMTINIGLIQMVTFNINPFEKDLPQMTMDLIYIFGKRTIIFEIYDLMIDKNNKKYKNYLKKLNDIKEKISDFKLYETKKVWYEHYLSANIKKSTTANDDMRIVNFFKDVVNAYIEFAKDVPSLNDIEKEKKYFLIKGLSDEFVKQGGVAVNLIKKAFGEDKTREILGRIIFGYLNIKDLNLKLYKKMYVQNNSKFMNFEEDKNLIQIEH